MSLFLPLTPRLPLPQAAEERTPFCRKNLPQNMCPLWLFSGDSQSRPYIFCSSAGDLIGRPYNFRHEKGF